MKTKVKGAVLLARRALVVDEYGVEAWERVVSSLPDADQSQLRGILLTSSWYDFGLNERLDAAIVEVVGKGDPKIFEQIGARSAKQNLGGPHKGFIASKDPQRFLGLTDRIFQFYYDTGYREYEATGPTSGVITTFEADTFSETDCLTVIGWYKEALRMIGVASVEIRHPECRAKGAEVCRYEIEWQA